MLTIAGVFTNLCLDGIASIEEHAINIHRWPDANSCSVCVDHAVIVQNLSSLSA
jgi:hypothetical protein